MVRYIGERPQKDLRKIKRKEIRIRTMLGLAQLHSLLRQLEKFAFELYDEKRIGTLLVLKDRVDTLTECREVKELTTMLKTFSKQYQSQGVTEKEEG